MVSAGSEGHAGHTGGEATELAHGSAEDKRSDHGRKPRRTQNFTGGAGRLREAVQVTNVYGCQHHQQRRSGADIEQDGKNGGN